MNRTKLILICVILLATNAFAQKITISPQVGIGSYFCKVSKENPNDVVLKSGNFTDVNFCFSTDINYKTKKYDYTLGYKLGEANLSVKMNPNKGSNNPYANPKLISNEGIDQHYITFSIFKNGRIRSMFPIKLNEKQRYLLNMSISPFLGMGFTIRGNVYPMKDTTSASLIYDKAEYWYEFKKPNWYGASLQAGVRFLFYHAGKERLSILLWYNQGLNVMESAKFTFKFNNQYKYTADIASRGSYIGFTFGYPILIWTKKESGLIEDK